MARSSYIYIVKSIYGTGDPVAAFTVKHEMLIWLQKCGCVGSYMIYRLSDGDRRDGIVTDITNESQDAINSVPPPTSHHCTPH